MLECFINRHWLTSAILWILFQRSIDALVSRNRSQLQSIFQVFFNMQKSRPILWIILQHLRKQIPKFWFIHLINTIEIYLQSSLIKIDPILHIKIQQQRSLQQAQSKYKHIRFNDVNILLIIQYLWWIQSISIDIQWIFSNRTRIQQFYLFSQKDFIAIQHSICDIQILQIFQCFCDTVDDHPKLLWSKILHLFPPIHYLFLQTNQCILIDSFDSDIGLIRDNLIIE